MWKHDGYPRLLTRQRHPDDGRRPRSDDSGQAMVEFALILPILCLILFGILQFGIVLMHYHEVTGASRAGARKASVCKSCANGAQAAIDAARNSTSALDKTKVSVTLSPSSASAWTRGSDVAVTASYPYSINLLGIVVSQGQLKSTSRARVE
jgi:Flp pilus assembly protein TadG